MNGLLSTILSHRTAPVGYCTSDRVSLVYTTLDLRAESLLALGSGGAGNLESNGSTERTGGVVVGNLHQAEVLHACGGIRSSAGGAGGDLDGERLERG
jgi:hypothetical protein